MDYNDFLKRQKVLTAINASMPMSTKSEDRTKALFIVAGALLGATGGGCVGRAIGHNIGSFSDSLPFESKEMKDLSQKANKQYGTIAGALLGGMAGSLGGRYAADKAARDLRRKKIDEKLAELNMTPLTDEEAESMTEITSPFRPMVKSIGFSVEPRNA